MIELPRETAQAALEFLWDLQGQWAYRADYSNIKIGRQFAELCRTIDDLQARLREGENDGTPPRNR